MQNRDNSDRCEAQKVVVTRWANISHIISGLPRERVKERESERKNTHTPTHKQENVRIIECRAAEPVGHEQATAMGKTS